MLHCWYGHHYTIVLHYILRYNTTVAVKKNISKNNNFYFMGWSVGKLVSTLWPQNECQKTSFIVRPWNKLLATVIRNRNTGSHPIIEVKQCRARLALEWVTTGEYRVLYTFSPNAPSMTEKYFNMLTFFLFLASPSWSRNYEKAFTFIFCSHELGGKLIYLFCGHTQKFFLLTFISRSQNGEEMFTMSFHGFRTIHTP